MIESPDSIYAYYHGLIIVVNCVCIYRSYFGSEAHGTQVRQYAPSTIAKYTRRRNGIS